MTLYILDDRHPQLADPVWIAPNATVIGDVRLGKNVSLWWNTVLRGDHDPITIGEDTNIQDGSILHTDPGAPLVIGCRVTVGHLVMLHGCTIGNDSLIGMKSVILNHAVIGQHCLIGANTLIPEGKIIPDRSVVIGSPGKIVREVTDKDLERIRRGAQNYLKQWPRYLAGLRETR